jgi:hypothetical protein
VTGRRPRRDLRVRSCVPEWAQSRSSDRMLARSSDLTHWGCVRSVVTYANILARGVAVTRGRWWRTGLWCCVRSWLTRHIWSQNRGSGSSLEMTRLWGSGVRSWSRGASGQVLAVRVQRRSNAARLHPIMALTRPISLWPLAHRTNCWD